VQSHDVAPLCIRMTHQIMHHCSQELLIIMWHQAYLGTSTTME